jgi:hypothetical protein
MRITKKFTGKARLGKKLYKGSDTLYDTPRLRENAASHLQVRTRLFRVPFLDPRF